MSQDRTIGLLWVVQQWLRQTIFSYILLAPLYFIVVQFVFIALMSLCVLGNIIFSDVDRFLFNPDAVLYEFCLTDSAQILMTEFVTKYHGSSRW